MIHPECTYHDDPLALALWKSDRPALFTVWCVRNRHRLAKVFEINGQRRLVLPGWTFHAQAMEMGNVDHGDTLGHGHAFVGDLVSNEQAWQACSCGIFCVSDECILADLDSGRQWHLAMPTLSLR